MLTLLSECHFWTIRDEIRIKPTDLGAFRYARMRDLQQTGADDFTLLAKRDYIERRNGTAILKNSNRKAAGRLKDNLKKLEELLRTQRVVYSQWQDSNVVLLLFSSGLIAHICVDIYTGDILRMVFEKYFVGKLAAEVITDAFFTRSHIVLAYNTNQLTVVYLQKPNVRSQGPEKIANMDPRIFHVIIPGHGERKLARHLAVNNSFDLFVIWTKSSQNEVFPWRPTVRDQDRANIHVFKLKGSHLESISYCWTENDPLCIDFLRSTESQILTVEQKVSRKGEISAETCSYEIVAGKMQRTALSSIPLGTEICSFAFSPDQEKLFLGTIDRYVCLHDLVHQNTQVVTQIDIVPTHCSWHSDSSIVMVANDRAQFQCFDLALTPIASQLQSEDVTPSNLLDISHYFVMQPTLVKIALNQKPDLTNFSQTYAQTDSFLLILFENGPLGCLRFFAGAGMRGDIHNSGLTADVIVDKYLSLNQLEKAVNLLGSLNWDTYGAMCLISLHKIANYIFFRSDAKRARVDLLAKALKTFTNSLSEETKDEFSDQVFDLKRRFFFFLLRNNLYADAFEVALDVEDYDLFMDLFNNTKAFSNFKDFTATSFRHAAAILQEEDRGNLNTNIADDCQLESVRSESSCSEAINTFQQNISSNQYHEKNQNMLKNYVPPLPSIKSNVLNAEMIKINIPKPELRIANIEQERTQTLPTRPIPSGRNLDISSSFDSGSNLASLTSKSRTNQISVNPHSNVSLLWQHSPNQTIGIPTILNAPTNPYVPSTSHNILPRASTTASIAAAAGTINTKLKNFNTTNYIHYASPSLIASPTTNNALSPVSVTQIRPVTQMPIMPIPTYQPKFYQHPLVSGTIPPTSSSAINILQEDFQKRLQKKPSASILSNGSASQNGNLANAGGNSNTILTSSSKDIGGKSTAGEKNKVKFSDTVQVAVVPEISRKDKPLISKRNGYSRPASSRIITNPKKELADSLPLCHPNDDYLKDFNPISCDDVPRPPPRAPKDQSSSRSKKISPPPPPSIKVVHFGVV